MRDPYSILGVKRNADSEEIKAAWRSKAKTVHPDHNQDDPSATGKFAEVGQAYDLLKDPAKRKRYDQAADLQQTIMQQRQAARAAAERAKREADAERIMEELARANAERAQKQATQEKPQQSKTVETPEDMVERIFGAAASEKAASESDRQKNSDQTGNTEGTEHSGESAPLPAKAFELLTAFVRRFRNINPPPEKAPDLSMDAVVTIDDLLKQNWVTVRTADERDVRFPIEKGMTDGHVLNLKGQGIKIAGMKQGDLNVTLRVQRDLNLRVDGLNIHTVLPISLEDAVLGGEASVETPEGARTVTIPAWSGSDQTIKLEGLGLYDQVGARGDFIVELRIVLWEKPDDKVTDLMRHMKHGLYV